MIASVTKIQSRNGKRGHKKSPCGQNTDSEWKKWSLHVRRGIYKKIGNNSRPIKPLNNHEELLKGMSQIPQILSVKPSQLNHYQFPKIKLITQNRFRTREIWRKSLVAVVCNYIEY